MDEYDELFGNLELQDDNPYSILETDSDDPYAILNDVDISSPPSTSDLKEKIDEAPWYESMLYEFNKFKFNALFCGAEGVGELASSVV